MRTTLTLDDDVAAALRDEARRTGKPFKQVVNDLLRRAMAAPAPAQRPFRVQARRMGVRPGVDLDNISALIEEVEGPTAR